MEAIIFAAGLGTRLRPLTDRRPKAVIEVGGVPVIERVARQLVDAGADRLVVNTHAFPEQVHAALAAMKGVEILFSHEADAPLETGGGLLHAAPLLHADAPIFLHNADVLTDLPLRELYDAHRRSGALATLAVQDRLTSRRLLFDDTGLCGREDADAGIHMLVREPTSEPRSLAFCGVHVIDGALPRRVPPRQGAFSIVELYLQLAADGEPLNPFGADGYRWIDIGSPARLAQAEALFGGTTPPQ